jgi:CRISPR system Cascade subunit CasA
MHKNSLLIKPWIPVIDEQQQFKQITLKALLCTEHGYQISLPRDDMVFACIQFIVAIVQVCFTPKNKDDLKAKIKNVLAIDEFDQGIKGKENWFDLDHHETPFMQFRCVKAKEPTALDKLLPGVNDGTNKTFVNPNDLATGLCSSCVAIAIFNFANNSAGVGGGFKNSLRSSIPITMLIKIPNIRKMLWANVLHEESLVKSMPKYKNTLNQKPNYIDNFIKPKEKLYADEIGLARGLLWQPNLFELLPASKIGCCSMCATKDKLYTAFYKEKFNYTIENIWRHPLSPVFSEIKKGKLEEKFPSFNKYNPCWSQLSKFVLKKESDKAGQIPAPVFVQASGELLKAHKIQFILGGYVNNQATITDRRHESFTLSESLACKDNIQLIDDIIDLGLKFKYALRKPLFLFYKGIKDKIAGTGIDLCNKAEKLYYQQTEQKIHNTLGNITVGDNSLKELSNSLASIVKKIFNQITEPYKEEPKMLKLLAISRRILNKSISELKIGG